MFKGSFEFQGRTYLFKFLAAGAQTLNGQCKTDCLFFGLSLNPDKGKVYVLQCHESGWMQPGGVFPPTPLGRAALVAAGK